MFENHRKCLILIFDILAFSIIFSPYKIELSGNAFRLQAEAFKPLSKNIFF